MIIACIISFVIGAFAMMCAIGLMSYQKNKKQLNKVHFYVAKDNFTNMLSLHLGKPIRGNGWWASESFTWRSFMASGNEFERYHLNIDDFKNLKWEDEPVEVFLNLED